MLSTIHKVFKQFLDLFNEISKFDIKYFPDKEEFELDHNRNKALLLIHGSAFLQIFSNIFIGNGDLISNIQGLIGTSFICSALIISCRLSLHPQIFKSIYNLYVFSFGVSLISNGYHGIIGSWLIVTISPVLVYFLTGNIYHFLIHITCKTILINTVYQDIMKTSLAYLPVNEALDAFTYFTNQNNVYSLVYTLFIHYTIQKAFHKVRVAEKKKDDFEKQKNFLLGFSHELRNLINSLMGNVKLASLEKLSEKTKDLLLNAEVCAELLLHLVNNILDTGKVEIGELEINPGPTRVYDTLERIWGISSELIKRKNLRGRIKIQRNVPQMLIFDHYRITQIFLNLIGNAVKYTDSGNVDVTVEWIEDTEAVSEICYEPYPFNDSNDQDEGIFEKVQALSILDEDFLFLNFSRKRVDRNLLPSRASSNKGILKISVSDTGCGICKDDFPNLFKRFTQGTIDPSKKKLGTGLGLFITKELCQKMNGDVRVFSQKDRGSAFIVCLPLDPVPANRAFFFDLEGIQRIAMRQRLRAMIVDDESLCHLILRDFLNKMSIDVVDIAENGLIAYKRFLDRETRKDYVNIITMDLSMPVMGGKMAAQKIREHEAARNLEPCMMIVVSGNCTDSEIRECLDKNGKIKADAFLKKPVNVDELCRIISCHFGDSYDRQRVRLLTD